MDLNATLKSYANHFYIIVLWQLKGLLYRRIKQLNSSDKPRDAQALLDSRENDMVVQPLLLALHVSPLLLFGPPASCSNNHASFSSLFAVRRDESA